MNQQIASQTEEGFNQLSVSEQLRVIENLVHRVRENALGKEDNLDKQLAIMADDAEIQNEIRQIEREFSCADADGLENS
jgi:hypothetical protein